MIFFLEWIKIDHDCCGVHFPEVRNWRFPAYRQGNDQESHDFTRTFRTTPCEAIRDGDWKLIEYFEHTAVEVFNRATNSGELCDLALDDPA